MQQAPWQYPGGDLALAVIVHSEVPNQRFTVILNTSADPAVEISPSNNVLRSYMH